MDAVCLEHSLTSEEQKQFEQDGFFIVADAIPSELVADLTAVTDRIIEDHRQTANLSPHSTINMLDFIGKDQVYLQLIDWHKTFPKVWGILGWNIKLYHSHLIVTPPQPDADPNRRLGWHQDSGRLNIELEGNPRPRVSLKVGFFLSDTTRSDRGNFHVLPGAHRQNSLDLPTDGTNPVDACPVCVPAGTAVFFDRRLWHAAGINTSNVIRRVLFYGYSYRWLQPRDDMTVDHYMEKAAPIRQQLLGKSTGGMGYTSPGELDVPLRSWLTDHLGAEAVPG
ncbi:hypothetical protein CMK14_04285 [Candidatus Poribacteria bacterium]|nr:hypothetical protein [Candidatus Poribacteria bacterium]